MKKFLLRTVVFVLFAGGCLLTSVAQVQLTVGKSNVYIDYFKFAKGVSFDRAELLRNTVLEKIMETERVEITDVDAQPALRVERSRRESGELSLGDDLNALAVMTEEGASALLIGNVTSLTTERKKDDKGKVTFDATVKYTIKAINPQNGKLLEMANFEHSGSSDTENGAIAKACSSVSAKRAIKKFIYQTFKVTGEFLQIETLDRRQRRAETVYIGVGSEHGVIEKNHFDVCVFRKIGTRESLLPIGEVTVQRVEGGDLSYCKVKDGHEEIKKAVDSGQQLFVVSNDWVPGNDIISF